MENQQSEYFKIPLAVLHHDFGPWSISINVNSWCSGTQNISHLDLGVFNASTTKSSKKIDEGTFAFYLPAGGTVRN